MMNYAIRAGIGIGVVDTGISTIAKVPADADRLLIVIMPGQCFQLLIYQQSMMEPYPQVFPSIIFVDLIYLSHQQLLLNT